MSTHPAIETIASIVFFGMGPILWISGLRIFIRSPLSSARKAVWTSVLLTVGVAMGWVWPLATIRDRFVLLALALPVLAALDAKLARSQRSFSFWFRACAFEISTVFGVAAILRAVLPWLAHRMPS